jgi:hypothetical protein
VIQGPSPDLHSACPRIATICAAPRHFACLLLVRPMREPADGEMPRRRTLHQGVPPIEAVPIGFTEYDFMLLISHVLTCFDEEQIAGHRLFLATLIYNTKCVPKNLLTALGPVGSASVEHQVLQRYLHWTNCSH